MDFNELYHLLFETYAGIGILVGSGIVISLVVCVILEFKTRKLYRNHEISNEDDEWAIFEDEVEEAEEKAEVAGKASKSDKVSKANKAGNAGTVNKTGKASKPKQAGPSEKANESKQSE